MNSKLFIATKIKVGFNLRPDTYTGKLGYVIGHDGKKWRKEPSWEGWRQKYQDGPTYEQERRRQYDDNLSRMKDWKYTDEQIKDSLGDYEKYKPYMGKYVNDETINPVEFENIPTEGFVLNKKAGGYSNGWNHRSTYCRVYDPRGFEFEITIPNLLFILQECNAYKGKGLEGSFVYSWDGKDLVLLPTSCEEYTKSENFTKLQSGKVGVKDLLEGCTYKNKQLEEYIYLGKFNWFDETYNNKNISVKKTHVFYQVKTPSYGSRFLGVTNLSGFVQRVTKTPVSNYAKLLDNFNKTPNSGTLNNVVEEEYKPLVKMDSYYSRGPLGIAALPLGDNKYEIYEIEGNAGTGTRTNGSNYSYAYNVSSYNLKANKVVTLKSNDFNVTNKPTKNIDSISYKDLTGMNLKVLKITIKNKEQILTF